MKRITVVLDKKTYEMLRLHSLVQAKSISEASGEAITKYLLEVGADRLKVIQE